MLEKKGWIFLYSKILKQDIAYHLESGWVTCKDKTQYSPAEISFIAKNHGEISLLAHQAKKIFKGELADARQHLIREEEQGNLAENESNNINVNRAISGNIKATSYQRDKQPNFF